MPRLRTRRCCTRSITYSVHAAASLGMSQERETGWYAAGLVSITTGLPRPTCRKNFAAARRERLRPHSLPEARGVQDLRFLFWETAANPHLDLPSRHSEMAFRAVRTSSPAAGLTRKEELSEQASPSVASTRC